MWAAAWGMASAEAWAEVRVGGSEPARAAVSALVKAGEWVMAWAEEWATG